ncbi:cache domain-containing protein [Paenibacillus sp. J5C_2022]|uniref:cache domain-containing protein n=1 Tax=Paenibacillus sp. J5C2022 TaxID=2977129 RepID=UPI0021CE7583|nr:cache domain-containing protein [Paenibacillus sp. J5C2022]MCU6710884.1 cache domain-containing protein [Paenibacillus sp. J5C2022]
MALLARKRPSRIFLWLCILFTVIIMLFSLFLADRFSQFAASQLGSFHADKIKETVERSEFVLAKLKGYSMSMYDDQSLQNWFYSQSYEPLQDAETLRVLTKYLSNEPLIDSAYLFNMRKEQVMDSKIGLQSFHEFKDTKLLSRIQEEPPALMRFFHHTVGESSHPALILPSSPSQEPQYGYLVILLHKDMLEKVLMAGGEGEDNWLLMMDAEGTLILGEGDDELRQELAAARGSDDHGTFELGDGRHGIHVNYADLESQPWTIYSYTEMKQFYRQATSFKNVILGTSLILLAVLVVIAFWNSRQFMKPFRKLAGQLQRLLGCKELSDYSVIEQGGVPAA